MRIKGTVLSALLSILVMTAIGQDGFRIWPYLQEPGPEAMTILWFSEEPETGIFRWCPVDSSRTKTKFSNPVPANSLAYTEWEDTTFFDGMAVAPPYKHRIRLVNLEHGTTYHYQVNQGNQIFRSAFKTAPGGDEPVRLVVFADSETEPESTGNFTLWQDPQSTESRRYLLDQTTGFRFNLEVMTSRSPDLVLIAGDLTQHGGEQRDWDEFWNHLTDSAGSASLASQAVILPAPGNHDYYEGNYLDGYNQPGSERAIGRYLTYFEVPANRAENPRQEGRYHCTEYGPVTIVSLDVCNNGTNGSDEDTNFYLLGESDADGGNAPDFTMGSRQYEWLEDRLMEAQENSLFTFVMFHHVPYSTGPHGFPAGEGDLMDNQSGVPVRSLTPLLMQYGVDAVFSGHDEMWERSAIAGMEILPEGTDRAHSIHFYDVGTGGDGLRGPRKDLTNPNRAFLVHDNVPEVWENGVLKSGGKHYGHLEVNVFPGEGRTWIAELVPVHVFPVFNETDSVYDSWERRIYDDVVTLSAKEQSSGVGVGDAKTTRSRIWCAPNPFQQKIRIRTDCPLSAYEHIMISDSYGRVISKFRGQNDHEGLLEMEWNGTDRMGKRVAPGFYHLTLVRKDGTIQSLSLVLLP